MEKAELHAYVDKAKSGKLSALIRQHIFGDVVIIRAGNKVIRIPCAAPDDEEELPSCRRQHRTA